MNTLNKKVIVIVLVVLLLVSTFSAFLFLQMGAGNNALGTDSVLFSGSTHSVTETDLVKLKTENLVASKVQKFYSLAFEKIVPLTKEEEEEVKKSAKTIEEELAKKDPEKYKDFLTLNLRTKGFRSYEDLPKLIAQDFRSNKFITNFVREMAKKKPELFNESNGSPKFRIVSQILIRLKDTKKPTDEEKKIQESILKDLKEGKKFHEVIAEINKEKNPVKLAGKIGVISKETQFVKEFLDAAFKLKAGQYSDWVISEHGAHLIYVDSVDLNEILKEKEGTKYVYSVLSQSTGIKKDLLNEVVSKSGISFENEEDKKHFHRLLSVEEVKK